MHLNLFQTTSKLLSLARCGQIKIARKLFDEMSHKDSVAWNAMLTGYSQLGLYPEAISVFLQMRMSGSQPDHFSFSATLHVCAGASELRLGMRIHTLILILGYKSYMPVGNALIDMYGKCLKPFCARKVFYDMNCRNEVTWCSLLFAYTNSCQFGLAREVFYNMPERVSISWNMMIASHARLGEVEACLVLLEEMRESMHAPDQWTFSVLMHACSESSEVSYGCMLHALVIKAGWSSALEVQNSVLSFYAKQGRHNDAVKVFDSIDTPNQVSWNALIDAYMKVGDTQRALLAFQKAPERNVVSWTSMVAGYAINGNGELALSMFVDMTRNSVQPDDFVLGAVLHTCSILATLGQGKAVHGFIVRSGFSAYVYVANGLVNMYSKCGDLKGARHAFDDILHKDLVSWNAMLFSFGLHGRAAETLSLFEEMIAFGVKPDEVTFIGLLMTCSHLGLINEGRKFFKSMSSVYGLQHEADHVACMVDMLGRAGYVDEAEDIAYTYSNTRVCDVSPYEVLLGACHAHGNVGTGTSVGANVKMLEPQKEMSYVLLSNMYIASERWKEAELVRKAMADQGMKKVPGSSWIEVKNKVTVFVSGKNSHAYMGEICEILYWIEFEMRSPCTVVENWF